MAREKEQREPTPEEKARTAELLRQWEEYKRRDPYGACVRMAQAAYKRCADAAAMLTVGNNPLLKNASLECKQRFDVDMEVCRETKARPQPAVEGPASTNPFEGSKVNGSDK